MGNSSFDMGPLEMKIMGIMNGQNDMPVSDVQKLLKKSGDDLAYTTVMTVLFRLHKKGMLVRIKNGRQYMYSLKASKTKVSENILDKVRKALFRSDRIKPILALLDTDSELSVEELRELRKQVDERLKLAEHKNEPS